MYGLPLCERFRALNAVNCVENCGSEISGQGLPPVICIYILPKYTMLLKIVSSLTRAVILHEMLTLLINNRAYLKLTYHRSIGMPMVRHQFFAGGITIKDSE